MALTDMEAASAKQADYASRFEKVAYTKKWAVTMTKVRIRQAVAHKSSPRWQFVDFNGKSGSESRGVVDLMAIRKDHSSPRAGTKRGDVFQIILIQVKGGSAANPTAEDSKRLRAVQLWHHAQTVLLASWKKGKATQFYSLRPKAAKGKDDWIEVSEMESIFATVASSSA